MTAEGIHIPRLSLILYQSGGDLSMKFGSLGCLSQPAAVQTCVIGYNRLKTEIFMRKYDIETAEFVAAARKAAAYGLVQCSSGNLSRRVGPDAALLSASGSWLGELTADEVAIFELTSGRSLNGRKPTCESGFHLGILKCRADVQVVLHFQSLYATAIACGQPADYDYNLTIEVPVYIGEPAVVDYLPPGSGQLAEAVVDAFGDKQVTMAFLKNHGLVTVGKNFNDAIQKAVFFEMTCRILLTNPDAVPLPAEAVKALRQLGQA